MSAFHWLVELKLPSGSFSVRPILSDRTPAELDLDVHCSMAELLAWKAPARVYKVNSPCSSQARCHYLESAARPCRLTMGHFSNPRLARQRADELNDLFPHSTLPWTETMRSRFLGTGARAAAPQPAVISPPRAAPVAAVPSSGAWKRPAVRPANGRARAARQLAHV